MGEQLSANQAEISKLQSVINEEKANNDGLADKLKTLTEENEASCAEKAKMEKEFETLTAAKNETDTALKDLQASAEQTKEEQTAKITSLENECKALKERSEEETKSNEERVATL